MKIGMISFTERGRALSVKIKNSLLLSAETELFCKSKYWSGEKDTAEVLHEVKVWDGSIAEWAQEQFNQKSAALFIGACGIAVRAISSCLKNKLTDIPVLVLDEAGRFVIPVLSGHYGGANELAECIARGIGAEAVITTATDVNQLFAVDIFAAQNNLVICNREGIKEVSAAILAGEQVTIAISEAQHEIKYDGIIPEELTLTDGKTGQEVFVLVSPFRKDWKCLLWLCPKIFILGIGCRKGVTAGEIKQAAEREIEKLGIPMEAVAGIASIDKKRGEKGLCEFAALFDLPFHVFSAGELELIAGTYTSSSFVQSQMGVDNVCERAAMAAAGKGARLVLKKQADHGITVAAAIREWRVDFG